MKIYQNIILATILAISLLGFAEAAVVPNVKQKIDPKGVNSGTSQSNKEQFKKAEQLYYFSKYIQAMRILRPLAKDEYPPAQSLLGRMYLFGLGVSKDCVEAMRLSSLAAKKKDSRGQLSVGDIYNNGCSVQQDTDEAAKWYSLAFAQYKKEAEQGNSIAQNSLGAMYQAGKGATQDYTEAMNWYIKAAAQGNVSAQYNLGAMYKNGQIESEVPLADANEWFLKAANQGYIDAQVELGAISWESKDYAEAMKWYRKAAGQGNSSAEFYMGVMYDQGWGVSQDYLEAVNWYRKSAEQGIASAQHNLGLMYKKGQGVKADPSKAFNLFQQSFKNGNHDAGVQISELMKNEIQTELMPRKITVIYGLNDKIYKVWGMEIITDDALAFAPEYTKREYFMKVMKIVNKYGPPIGIIEITGWSMRKNIVYSEKPWNQIVFGGDHKRVYETDLNYSRDPSTLVQ